MNGLKERLEVIRLGGRGQLIAGAAALAAVAGLGGVLIGRSATDAPPAAEQAEGEAEGEEHGQEGFVPMTAEQLTANGIAVERVAAGSLSSEILAQATVTAPPEGQALVTARADGAIVRINKRLGDPVGAGETIALLESREAANLQAERSAAWAREQAAHAAAAREQRLFNSKITARQDLEAAISAHSIAESDLRRADIALRAAGVTGGRYLAVRSPITGRITESDAKLGAFVAAGTELFDVADPRRIQVEVSVPANDAQRIVPGDRAVVELPNGGLVDATVRSATPALDPNSRTATVVLQLNGAAGGLAQGQAVRARIAPRGGAADRIILPEEAVQQVEGRDVVFIATRGGFQATTVSTGSRSGGRVEILSGVKSGQTVVTRGAFVLKSQLGASEAEH